MKAHTSPIMKTKPRFQSKARKLNKKLRLNMKCTKSNVVFIVTQAMSRTMKTRIKNLFWEILQQRSKRNTQEFYQNKWSLSVCNKQRKDANTPTLAKNEIYKFAIFLTTNYLANPWPHFSIIFNKNCFFCLQNFSNDVICNSHQNNHNYKIIWRKKTSSR